MQDHAPPSSALVLAPGKMDPRLADLMITHGWPGLEHATPRETLLALLRYRPAYTLVQISPPHQPCLDLLRRIHQSSHRTRLIAWNPAADEPNTLEPQLCRVGVALYLQSEAIHRVTQELLTQPLNHATQPPNPTNPVISRRAS